MQKLLIALGTASLITVSSPALSQTTTPAATNDNATQVQNRNTDDEGFDWGWLGLLGLIGLAGLRGRHRDTVTTVR